VLDSDTFNIDRAEDRRKCVGRAYKDAAMTPALAKLYPQEDMLRDLREFCDGLWDYYIGTLEATERGGDAERKPIEFWLRPYIMREAGTIMFSPPGRGKSFIAMLMAVSIDAGIEKLWAVTRAKVLYINLERSAKSIDRRLGDINVALGLPRDRSLLRLDARGRTLADVWDAAKVTCEKHEVEVVLFDSVSRGGFGDLTENQPANAAMDGLNGLGPGWLALAHTPREDDSHVFGSTMFDAGADLMLRLTSSHALNGTMGVGLQGAKANDIKRPDLRYWSLEFDDDGLVGVAKAEVADYYTPPTADSPEGLIQRIEDYLGTVAEATYRDIADALAEGDEDVEKLVTRIRARVTDRRYRDRFQNRPKRSRAKVIALRSRADAPEMLDEAPF